METLRMKLSDEVSILPQSVARTVGDETVIVDPTSGAYFVLNPVATRIWELMSARWTLGQICEQMLDEYEVSREELEEGTLRLAQELADHGLISV